MIGPQADKVQTQLVVGANSNPYPTIADSLIWLDRNRNVYSDVAGTTPAAINGTIAAWRAVGYGWGSDLITQATAGNRPTLKSDGIQNAVANGYLSWTGITLGAAWTVYTVQLRPSGSDRSIALGDNVLGSMISAWDAVAYFPYQGSFLRVSPYTDTTNTLCIRRARRSSTTACHCKVGGSAELNGVCQAADTWFFDMVLARSGNASTSASRLRQIVVVNRNLAHDSVDDLAIRAKLLALEPDATDLA